MLFRSLDPVITIYLWHAELTRHGERVKESGEWQVSSVNKVVKIAGHSSLESVYHNFHLFLHCLHLHDDRWQSRIRKGRKTHVLSLWSALGITGLWSFLIPPFSVGSFLICSLFIWCRVFLVQLLFQVAVLFGEAFHGCDESLNIILEFGRGGFFFLNVVSGRH